MFISNPALHFKKTLYYVDHTKNNFRHKKGFNHCVNN